MPDTSWMVQDVTFIQSYLSRLLLQSFSRVCRTHVNTVESPMNFGLGLQLPIVLTIELIMR